MPYDSEVVEETAKSEPWRSSIKFGYQANGPKGRFSYFLRDEVELS
jgi:hypothetical protein